MKVQEYKSFLFSAVITMMAVGAVLCGGLDSNHWENGDGSTYTPPPSATNPPFDGVVYTKADVIGGPFSFTNVFCSSGIPAQSLIKSQLQQSTVELDSCALMDGNAIILLQQGKYQEAYDSAKHFIEVCALYENSQAAFTTISAANSGRSEDNGRFAECREWLKTVLYLNPDTAYYCADIGAIFRTMYWFDDEHGRHQNGTCAIIKFLLEENKCPHATEWLTNAYTATRESQLNHWRDTVHDSLATPLDTTLPSLEDLGLGILRGNPNSAVTTATSEERLGELIATRNPFTDVLELKYRLEKSTMTRIDVYDLLGRSVYSEGQGYRQDGEHILSLQTNSWVAGSYYVRLSTPGGDVKTVKVLKE